MSSPSPAAPETNTVIEERQVSDRLRRLLEDLYSPEHARTVADELKDIATHEITVAHIQECEAAGRDPALDQPSTQKRLAARAEALAVRKAGELFETADNVVRTLAVDAQKSQLYPYHDGEYDSAIAMIEIELQDLNLRGSEISDLRNLMTRVVPYMEKHKLPYAEVICQPGAKKKSRIAASKLNKLLSDERIADHVKTDIVMEVMADVANPETSTRAMESKQYGQGKLKIEEPPTIPPILCWDYLEPQGSGYLLLAYDRRQKMLLNAALQGITDLRHGTGNEAVLDILRRRKLQAPDSGASLPNAFRKKPVVVEAVQWFIGVDVPGVFPPDAENGESDCYVVTIHNQRAYLAEGDWVITEPDGEHHYPCKPEIFEQSYEPA